MRVHDSVTPHPLSARCPLRWYFVGKFRFSAELMVSYFYLMIASDPCFANLGPSLLWNSTMVAWPDGTLRSGRGGLVGHIKAKPRHSNTARSGLRLTAKLGPHVDPEPDRWRAWRPCRPPRQSY